MGKSQSDAYKKYHETLEQGANMNPDHVSLREIKEFYRKLRESAEDYVESSTWMGEPITTDGQIRVALARDCFKYGGNFGKAMEKATRYCADQDLPLATRIKYRQEDAEELRQKLDVLEPERNNAARNEAEPQNVHQM